MKYIYTGKHRLRQPCFFCPLVRLFGHRDGQRLYPRPQPSCSCTMAVAATVVTSICSRKTSMDLVNGVAHCPAYCSKFNPIEHRLLSHVTKACQGVLFDSLQTVVALMQKIKTQQGLSVTVRVLDKLYEGGRTVSEAFKKNMPIAFGKLLPKWNYWPRPQWRQIGILF